MKFLVDAQLPSLLCHIFANAGFCAIHVQDFQKGDESTDKEISFYADTHDYTVVTKDLDFHYSHMITGQPKRLLLIDIRNIKNNELFNIIRRSLDQFKGLFDQYDYVELMHDGLIGHGTN